MTPGASPPATGSTTRLRRLLALTGLVACLMLLDWSLDRVDAAKASLSNTEARLAKAQALRGQEQWLSAAESADALLAGALARVPEAESQGRAVAAVQGWVSELVEATDPTLRIQVASPQYIEAEGEGRRYLVVQVTLSGAMPPRRALDLLGRIESREQMTRIDNVELRAMPSPQMSIGFSTLYRIRNDTSP